MPPSGNGVIGNAVIEVTVDPSKIKAGFAQAAQVAAKETPKVAKQVDAQGGLLGAAGGIKEFSKPLREFREALQGTATAVFGMAGTVGLVVAGIGAMVAGIREAFTYATNVTTAFDKTGESIREATAANETLLARLRQIDEKYRPKFDQASDTFNTEKYKEDLDRQTQVLKMKQAGIKDRIENYKQIVAAEYRAVEQLKGGGASNTDDDVQLRYERIRHYAQLAEAAEIDYQNAVKETPRAAQQAAGVRNSIEAAQAEEIRAQTAKVREQIAEKSLSQVARVNKAEQEALLKLSEQAAQFTGTRLKAYQEMMAAMKDFYKTERDEIQKNMNAAIKAQQSVIKQGSLDALMRTATGVEDIGQKLDAISQQMYSMRNSQ